MSVSARSLIQNALDRHAYPLGPSSKWTSHCASSLGYAEFLIPNEVILTKQ